jgi:uncharacterized membrane protein YgcG
MVTADRAAPLRRVGSLLGLLGLEVAAVAGLHWLGRLPALQIPWERPLPWLLDSPVQDVLGSLLRMVALVMAYWLLASSVLYLLASLSHLPAAVRAVRWLTLPLVRRVADHAVAVTLATSMVGGGTLATAGTAVAAPGRDGGAGPPARRPVAAAPAPAPRPWAAAQPTTTGQDEPSEPGYRPRPAGQEPTTTGQGAPSPPRYRPRPAGQEPTTTGRRATTPPTTAAPTTATTATTQPTTTTGPSANRRSATTTTTTQPTTSATGPTTTTPTSATGPSTTGEAAGRSASPQPTPAPTTAARQQTTQRPTTTAPATTTGAGGTTGTADPQARAAGQPTTSATGLRPPAYRFNPAGTTTTTTTTPQPEAGQEPGQPGGQPGSGSKSGSSGGSSGGQEGQGGAEQATRQRVQQGDSLWTIARDRLAEVRGRRAAALSDREVAAYWVTVVEANQGGLRSGDPDLIYPGEEVKLPRVPGS